MINELSSEGLKFIVSDVIPQNSVLDLKICLQGGTNPFCSKARVLWQRQVNSFYQGAEKHNSVLYETAVVFTLYNSFKKQDYDSAIKKLVQKITVNRAHLRMPTVLDAELGRSGKAMLQSVIADIGINGAGILTDRSLMIGGLLNVGFELPDGHGRMRLKGKIIRRMLVNERFWFFGVEFQSISIREKETILGFMSSCLKSNV